MWIRDFLQQCRWKEFGHGDRRAASIKQKRTFKSGFCASEDSGLDTGLLPIVFVYKLLGVPTNAAVQIRLSPFPRRQNAARVEGHWNHRYGESYGAVSWFILHGRQILLRSKSLSSLACGYTAILPLEKIVSGIVFAVSLLTTIKLTKRMRKC